MATAHWLSAARPRRRTLLDVALVAALLGGSLVLLTHVPPGGVPVHPGSARLDLGKLDLVGVVLVAGSTVPLLASRRFPLGVVVVTATASAVLAGLGYQVGLLLGPTAALYLLAARRERQRPWTLRMTATVAVLLAAYLGATATAQGALPGADPTDPTGLAWAFACLAWAVAWFAGERTRLRREQIAELKQRAVRAERDAERERLLAAAEERARIARDLHDSAGHAISVIAVRAGAARLRHRHDPDRSLNALETIEELARHTVAEIDLIVGTLRGGGSANGAVEVPPGLASLDALVAHHQAAGLDVTLDISGAPRPLGAAADQAAYRILQEALTNAARHGAGSACVELAFDEAVLQLNVTNPVPVRGSPRHPARRLAAARPHPRPGGGHGLVGMRERATLLGGSLDADRCSDGAFRIRARIPYGSHRA